MEIPYFNKTRPSSRARFLPRALIMAILFSIPALAILSAHAETPAAKPPESKIIHVTADKLITASGARSAEFIGNVRATQGDATITADRMQIFYQSGKTQEVGTQSVRKMIARGNVKIMMEDKTAVAPQAVYTTADSILVLSGPGSKLISGKNTISGQKITLDRANGGITVERGKEKRVEAVIFSEDGGLN